MRPLDLDPDMLGHQLIDALQPADLTIEKVAYSAFYMTRLEWLLRKCDIERLWLCGIVTNGGVASTLRDAHVRDFDTTLLSDGCGAFSGDLHNVAVASLSAISNTATCKEAVASLAS